MKTLKNWHEYVLVFITAQIDSYINLEVDVLIALLGQHMNHMNMMNWYHNSCYNLLCIYRYITLYLTKLFHQLNDHNYSKPRLPVKIAHARTHTHARIYIIPFNPMRITLFRCFHATCQKEIDPMTFSSEQIFILLKTDPLDDLKVCGVEEILSFQPSYQVLKWSILHSIYQSGLRTTLFQYSLLKILFLQAVSLQLCDKQICKVGFLIY